MSKKNDAVRLAYQKGYRVLDDGSVMGITKTLKLSISDKKYGYYQFGIRGKNEKSTSVKVHRLQAYQKFGEEAFKEGVCVRHLNSDPLDNRSDNIAIGTASENRMDISKEKRQKIAINSASFTRKFSDKEMEEIRLFHEESFSCKETMKMFGISSRTTLYRILNHVYVTKIL